MRRDLMISVNNIDDIKNITKNPDGTYEVEYVEHKSLSGSQFVTADWREVPHYDKKGKLLTPEEYKKATIAKYGKMYFAQTEECVGFETVINTSEYGDIEIGELYEKDIFM